MAVAVLLPFAGAIYTFASGDLQAVWSLLWVGSIIALIWLFAYPVSYDLTPSALEVRSGLLFHKKILLSSIKEVYPTRNPLSAPAWSLDRLHVSYGEHGEGFLLVSPENKAEFMIELAKRDAGLVMQGERVVRIS